jgi:SecD/SecF fusion protein
LRSKSYLFLVVVLVLGALSGFGFYKLKFHKGLDISGGVRLTYQLDLSKLTKDQQADPSIIQQRVIHILEMRAQGSFGVAEPIITPKGQLNDEVIVELPEIQNLDEAEKTMGQSARIMYYWAKNVTTEKSTERPYIAENSKDSGDPGVEFADKVDGKLIPFGTPAYANVINHWDLILSGDEVTKAEPETVANGYRPLFNFSPSGAAKLSQWCRAHANQGENLAFVLDGRCISLNPLAPNTILDTNAIIEGTMPDEYVTRLCDIVNSGALPVDLKLLSSQKLDPTIGAQGFQKILTAGLIAFGVISVFLIGYYSFPGIVAFIALSLYVLFTLTVLKLINTTFSLAGIAGFILSVGMAVDANILVFERFKEEMKSGKSLTTSIELGFRRALTAIFDSNACTIITSLVLVELGTGPVKGFATTLIIGVVISLFTAVTVTRSLLMFFVGSGIATNPKWYAVNRNWFGKRFDAENSKPLQVVNKSKKWFAISAFTILISIPFFFLNGFRANVELKGGHQAGYAVTDLSLKADQIQKNLDAAGLRGGNVQFASVDATPAVPAKGTSAAIPAVAAHREVDISLPEQSGLRGTDGENLVTIAKAAGLAGAPSISYEKIGPQIQAETDRNAFLGVILSSALIIIFLAFRFGTGFGGFTAGLRFGASAIGALIHDILVVFGTAAIVGFFFHWEVSVLFLTAMLTMIGFSVHDTIVIFDRIRENLQKSKKTEDFGDLMNRSITQSFARSINTSATVIVTLLILVVFGTATNELKFFVVSMMIGIISGTYSSIYNASPILYLWDRAMVKKRGEAGGLIGKVAAEHAGGRIITPTAVRPGETPTTSSTGRSYGQVRRRANQAKRGIDMDE